MNMSGGCRVADFITNIENTDYPDITRATYNLLWIKYGYSARITLFWDLLKTATGDIEFELLDFKTIHNGEFMSWIIDRLIEWKEGKDVNFSEIYRAILVAGDFTELEKTKFEYCSIEERLWAIYLVVTSPGLKL